MYFLKDIQQRPIKKTDLQKILYWRNNKKIRNQMLNNKLIKQKEHKIWYNNLSKNKTSEAFIFLFNNIDVGYGIINNIDKINKTCTWGMYLDPNYLNSGLGVLLEFYVIERIFKYHKIRKIWGEALSVNKNMLNIHKKFGFNIEGILRKQIKTKNKYLDIVRISMFANEWRKNKKKFLNNLKMKKN